MTLTENLFENLRLELRRGCLTLAVLAQLRQERYGYTLRKALADDGLVIEWREEEKRNKRFYRLTPDGEQIFARLLQEWHAINASIQATLNTSTNRTL